MDDIPILFFLVCWNEVFVCTIVRMVATAMFEKVFVNRG